MNVLRSLFVRHLGTFRVLEKLFQLANSAFSTYEELRLAVQANKIRFVLLAYPFLELATTKLTGKRAHLKSLVTLTLAIKVSRPRFSHEVSSSRLLLTSFQQ